MNSHLSTIPCFSPPPHEGRALLVRKFKLNSKRRLMRLGFKLYLTPKRYHSKRNRLDYQLIRKGDCRTEQAIPKFNRELGRVSNFNQSINWHHHIKDHVEIDWSFDQVWCFYYEQRPSYGPWNMAQNPYKRLILRQRPPKPNKLLKFFMISTL